MTSDDAPPPVAKVVIRGKSGAPMGSAYLVKGKVRNEGGARASAISVRVIFKGPAGAAIAEVEARCPRTLEPGASGAYEAAVSGERAEQVEGFTVDVTFEGG